jgi:glycosyltransferase involved in cell wall biosynthesis
MIEGLVSTIIPVYNRGAMLREAVDSVLAQTWRPIEVIIVDDGSTDDTSQVMVEIQSRHPEIIRRLHQENSGPGAARQAGLDIAEGEFVQFLDSDDLLLPDKFTLQVSGLRSNSEAGISYGKCYSRDMGIRQPDPAQSTGKRHDLLFPALLNGPLWPTLVPLYRRAVIDMVGPWPSGRQLEDWRYDAKAGSLKVRLDYVDAFVAETRNHGEGRLCNLWLYDADALKEHLAAYPIVLAEAKIAGVEMESPDVQRFARTLFMMARRAASRGLNVEARGLLRLARENTLGSAWDMRLFAAAAGLLGWARASRLAESFRRGHES